VYREQLSSSVYVCVWGGGHGYMDLGSLHEENAMVTDSVMQ
jgi:hypothetical protein